MRDVDPRVDLAMNKLLATINCHDRIDPDVSADFETGEDAGQPQEESHLSRSDHHHSGRL